MKNKPASPANTPLPHRVFDEFARTIRLLGHPQRLRILEFLDLNGESAVNEIVTGISALQSAVSQHLGQMRAAGIIQSQRDGRQVRYRITSPNAITILNCIRSSPRIHSP